MIAAATLTACAKDAERAPAERRNMTALNAIPSPPGAITASTTTHGRTAPDTSEGPIVGWTTNREVRLTRRLRAEQVIARAREDLEAAGWRIAGGADFYLNARRGGSCLHLLTTAHAPSSAGPIPSVTADTPASTSEPEPGDVIARGLTLSVTDC